MGSFAGRSAWKVELSLPLLPVGPAETSAQLTAVVRKVLMAEGEDLLLLVFFFSSPPTAAFKFGKHVP